MISSLCRCHGTLPPGINFRLLLLIPHYCCCAFRSALFQFTGPSQLSAYLSPTMSHLNISDAIDENPASSLASCSYVLHSDSAAVSSAKNARRRAAYASKNAEKRASMLLARRSAFAKRPALECVGMNDYN
ncbi:hypothetical protein OROMI_009602 [Orobanche minor]